MGIGGGARLGQRGQVVDDRYRLEELIGAGGFGEVWRATQEVEGEAVRDVALKLLVAPQRTATGSSGGPTDDWLNEVRAVRNVDCSAIAPIYDVGVARDNNLAFICMLLLSGETLHDRLKRGSMPWRRALSIARDVAGALRACHEVEVQHCDLKPQNIFLRTDGDVYVLDFGVARLGLTGAGGVSGTAPLAALEEYEAGVTGTVEVTGGQLPPSIPQDVAHQVYGTPGFISPERYSGDPPTPASDVYALGVVLYQMLTGTLPYKLPPEMSEPTADSTAQSRETFRAQLHTAAVRGDIRALAEVAPHIPSEVAGLVHSMLALRADDRPTDSLLDRIDTVWRRPYGVPDPPYVGLESFDERRAGYIAGRDADIDQIVTKLETGRTIVLVGPSGCGKSSLAIAGVAAGIDQRLLGDTDGWETVVVRPTDRDAGLRPATGDGSGPAGVGTVVIVDQLEEVLGLEAAERERFGRALVALARGSAAVAARDRTISVDHPVRVIATVRDDLFGPVAALPELDRVPESNVYTVRGVDPNGMTDIVCAPALDAGYALEGADDVVADAQRILSADASALPMVQFALTQWWDERDRDAKRLTRAAWDGLGGIEGALAEVAQTLYDRLDETDREHMKSLLVSMFRADGTRVQVAEAKVSSEGRARAVLDRLIERRLVQRQVDADDRSTLEVVHEALARRWPLLHSWLETHRAERELLEDATYDAARWRRDGRPAEMLWRGERLEAAARVENKLGEAREFIATATAAAGRQRRMRRTLIAGAFTVLSAFVIVLVVLFVRSNAARKKAETSQATAERKTEEANESARVAEDAKQIAEQKQREAEEALARADKATRAQGIAEDKADDLAEQMRVADEKRLQAQKAAEEADRKARDADNKARDAQAKMDEAARKTREAEAQMAAAERALERVKQDKQRLEADVAALRKEKNDLNATIGGDNVGGI